MQQSEPIIGALAFVTLAVVIIFAIVHFTRHLREPRSRDAAKNALKEDGSSAHTAVRGGSKPDHLS